MSGRNVFLGLLLALIAIPLAASLRADAAPEPVPEPGQYLVEWSEQHLLFVADERSSRIQSFHLGTGAPVVYAQTRRHQHSRVRDMQLDAQRGKLWVLGYNGVSVYDARSLVLQRYIPLEGASISVMRIESDRVVLVAGSGVPVGEIDSRGRLFG